MYVIMCMHTVRVYIYIQCAILYKCVYLSELTQRLEPSKVHNPLSSELYMATSMPYDICFQISLQDMGDGVI